MLLVGWLEPRVSQRKILYLKQSNQQKVFLNFLFFKRFYFFIFTEKGREREREGEKHQCVVASCTPHAGDLAHNPGMCPDWELNLRPFGSQSGAQSTEPHQPGPVFPKFQS